MRGGHRLDQSVKSIINHIVNCYHRCVGHGIFCAICRTAWESGEGCKDERAEMDPGHRGDICESCRKVVEAYKRLSDDAKEACPACGGSSSRLAISLFGARGSGSASGSGGSSRGG